MRELAAEVGIKAASIYHHFPSKVDLAAAITGRYWQDTKAWLKDVANAEGDATAALRKYPETVRMSLENGNRLCLGSFLGA
jgi:TetR/AcrR family transcriptional repressor of nem operon